MIGLNLIRNSPDLIRKAITNRGLDAPIDRILEIDSQWRSSLAKCDQLRAQRNQGNRKLGQMENRPSEMIKQMKEMGEKVKLLEEEIRGKSEELHKLLLEVPNLHDNDVPIGPDESHNVVVRTIENHQQLSFKPLSHWELGENLSIIDLARGAKLSGSRFFVLKGKGARLQRALISWMLDLHVQKHGYEELYVPYLVNTDTATGSGQLPKFRDTMYHDEESDLWLVPTAEVPITGMHRNEIFESVELPKCYVAHTPCFRRERTAAGRDTRGIKRVHQFEKVEMYKFVEPEESETELDNLVMDASDVCSKLGISYRIIELCTGDLGFGSAKSFDIETWAPGSGEWLEVSSCSNVRDFQARRASIRYRPKVGGRPKLIHTLNGSGLALPRIIITILENCQQSDGSVIIPEALRPYTGFERIK